MRLRVFAEKNGRVRRARKSASSDESARESSAYESDYWESAWECVLVSVCERRSVIIERNSGIASA